jgi:hypothetical protein
MCRCRQVWYGPIKKWRLLPEKDLALCFGNINDIQALHVSYLNALRERMANYTPETSVGELTLTEVYTTT